MSLTAKIVISSGKATCILCKKTISKHEPMVLVKGYQTEGRMHRILENCKVNVKTSEEGAVK